MGGLRAGAGPEGPWGRWSGWRLPPVGPLPLPQLPRPHSLTCVGGARLDVSRQGGARPGGTASSLPGGTSSWVWGSPEGSGWAEGGAQVGVRGAQCPESCPHSSGGAPFSTLALCRAGRPRLTQPEAPPAPAQHASAALWTAGACGAGVEGGEEPGPKCLVPGGFVRWVVPPRGSRQVGWGGTLGHPPSAQALRAGIQGLPG